MVVNLRDQRLIVLSNRGPLTWRPDSSGRLVAHRGAGGLVSALTGALAASGGTWIASALSDADRQASYEGQVSPDCGFEVQLLDIESDDFAYYLDVVSNGFLWYAHHDMWNRPFAPSFDTTAWDAWDAYVRVNERFAAAAIAAIEAAGPVPIAVLVQDFHLALVPDLLRRARPDIPIAHFSHTPFAPPSSLGVLPTQWSSTLVRAMASANLCGFHTRRWADRFVRSASGLGTKPTVGVFPLGPDAESLKKEASGKQVIAQRHALDELLAGRRAIVRVDRSEPSKNVLRGIAAYDLLLTQRRELVATTAHVVALNPSRQSLKQYRKYLKNCQELAETVNERHGRDVVILSVEDRYERSLAALAAADVIVANPIADGMNLVAKEGPLVNERDAPLVLSTEAGAHAELGALALSVNPYDTAGTARAIAEALDMPITERRNRAAGIRAVAAAHPPATWLRAQLDALEQTVGSS